MKNSAPDPIPRGNTVAGVNALIIDHLMDDTRLARGGVLLDIPCGGGEFLDAVGRLLPQLKTIGCDLTKFAGFNDRHRFIQADLNDVSDIELGSALDVVTCISGVMEFDNTLAFFKKVREILRVDGEFIVTNDNHLTVFDRLKYLFTGGTRRADARTIRRGSTWKMVTEYNLVRCLADAGFAINEIRRVPVNPADWLWSPLAGILYLTQNLGTKSGIAPDLRSLLSRHYIVVCQPRPDGK